MAAATLPPSWSVAGVTGANKDISPVRLSRDEGGVFYDMAAFPLHLTPSDLIGAYTRETIINVATRFAEAGAHIANTCARAPGCNEYFRKLGHGISLSDLLQWNVVFYLWLAKHRTAAPHSDATISVVQGEVEYSNKEKRFARIVIGETALRDKTVLAATIVHELAHVAGAPGGRQDERDRAARDPRSDEYKRLIQAEGALKACALGAQFDPNALGALPREFGTRRIT